MTTKIKPVGAKAEQINTTGRALRRVPAGEFAAALAAEPCGEAAPRPLDPISLAAIGNNLIERLRSTGGRPALHDADEICKVPLSKKDVQALEKLIGAIENSTGAKPSLGQVASSILRIHLERLRRDAG